MSWDAELFTLLDDLEQQAETVFAEERDVDLADRSRAEYQQVSLASRLMASVGTAVRLDVAGVGMVSGTLDRVADGWCLLGPDGSGAAGGHDWIVASGALLGVRDVSERSVPEVAWSPLTRLSLGSALRRLAESGERCVLHLRDGARHEGEVRRVGRDFVELRDPAGHLRLVPFSALAAAQSHER